MRIVQTINIIDIDHGKLPSASDPQVVQFVSDMRRGDIFPPIGVERLAGNKFRLKDGRHRLKARMLLGESNIHANIAVTEQPYPYKPFVSNED